VTTLEPKAPSTDAEDSLSTIPTDIPRGRLVMVVDNTIEGDSRVQKSAMAAAALGWETTLIGRSPSGRLDTYSLGGATVLLVPVMYTLHSRRRRAPGLGLRWPLAYRDVNTAAWRTARLDARVNDVRVERAHYALGSGSAVGPATLFAMRGSLFAGLRWHRLRQHEMRRAIRFYTQNSNRPAVRLKTRLWAAIAGERCWRHLEPLLRDYELAFGPHVERLKPDIIHSHDFRMVGLAVRAAIRLKARGNDTKVVHDVHEFLPGVRAQSEEWRVANEAHEREYLRRADVVLTVSDRLAQMLVERHGLAANPTVVLNAPARRPLHRETGTGGSGAAPSLRADCDLPDGTPLLVYGGSAAAQRGLLTAVRALPLLPGAHLALVVTRNLFVAELEELARTLGVGDRVHVLPYVAQDLVPTYYSSADVGLIPILHYPNHEIALITKYFEYTHARLPIVTSDVETMAFTTREIGNGEVFTADDHVDLARAVSEVLADPPRYRSAYTPELLARWSWESQTEILAEVWDRLHPAGLATSVQAFPGR
jgi:glycosyltransferase involved in cell wall biosynthesis